MFLENKKKLDGNIQKASFCVRHLYLVVNNIAQ